MNILEKAPTTSSYELQSPRDFRDDFVCHVENAQAGQRALLEVMQFEVTTDTLPIFEAMQLAKERGVDTRFIYDRVALRHIRAEGDPVSQAYAYLGRNLIRFGDKTALDEASRSRLGVVTSLERNSITSASNKKRAQGNPHRSHNHIKLAVVGNTAWFGTMNLRGIDFEMSNFMLKLEDPDAVSFLGDVFAESEQGVPAPDIEYQVNETTQLLVDGGRKGESIIFDKAVAMAHSLEPGDRFTMISQWPPVKIMYGELSQVWQEKMKQGVPGEFLLPPEDKLHPSKKASRYLQGGLSKTKDEIKSMSAINLTTSTHAKAFLITRASGEEEVLFGSHNLTRWTVRNGTKELAMWSRDPAIVAQIKDFLDSVKNDESTALQ